jgi:hypothetical protein
MVIRSVNKYWPSFRESKLTSWLSTVVNAVLRELNDKEGAEITEDFDIVELISCTYPV